MVEPDPDVFTIRVYGLIVNINHEVLVSDEFQLNMEMTKFPGGGLNFGEGTIDCLKRELMEECSQEIEDIRHFYTTDFFQKALFWPNHQLISIYYLAKIKDPIRFKVSGKAFDFTKRTNGSQSFRWIAADKINPEEFTFPIDKHVAHLLKEYLIQK
ncbi:MAG: NUDIX domain-containing protein [Bacteroidota bacterium]|nr:NUDIX domain-containing protein [Bacteroidota bacterium]